MSEVLDKQGKKKEFDNEVFLVTLDNGLKVVFKPDDMAILVLKLVYAPQIHLVFCGAQLRFS